MSKRITDVEIDEWLVDIESGCVPSAEAFLAVCDRLSEAENTLEELRESLNAYAVENAELVATVRDLS